MATSLFEHERIITTRAKGKVLKAYAEKLITRAKNALDPDMKPEQVLHNKREIMKHIQDRAVVVKLFEEIAPRYKERNGGYTRTIHLPERQSDSAEMSIIELVDKKVKERKPRAEKAATVSKNDGSESGDPQDKKWFSKFLKK